MTASSKHLTGKHTIGLTGAGVIVSAGSAVMYYEGRDCRRPDLL